jgi:GT2 family glycosyltransferase
MDIAKDTYVVIPNWNGEQGLARCLDALLAQTKPENIIVVDNASVDGSIGLINNKYPNVVLLQNKKNLGFAGGVNTGIKFALKKDAKYIALINNDAVADKNWLKALANQLDENTELGIATSKILDAKDGTLDSTGEQYTIWGLPFPRGRGEAAGKQYDKQTVVFGASGGASIYRVKMLEEIGLFDEDFFAYYEDVDLSFRAQLAGWKVGYVPDAVVHHQIGATGGKVKGLYTYQTLKNLPLLLWKNVPWALMPKIWPRLVMVYLAFVASALARGQIWPILMGLVMGTIYWPKKLVERRRIQKGRKVTSAYINSIIVHDLPPQAHRLRKLRSGWWRVRGTSGR